MPTPKLSLETMRATLDLRREHGGIAQASVATGIPRCTLQHRYHAALQAVRAGLIASPPIPEIGRPPADMAVTQNAAAYDADGNLLAQWVKTRRDSGAEYTVPAGHVVRGESALVDADNRIVARWVKTAAGPGERLVDGLLETFAAYRGASPHIPEPAVSDDDLLTVYPLPDLHLGMLSWAKETGSSYDMKIATEMAIRGIETLVSQSRPSRHAVLLGLGDWYHNDDQRNVTPGSGHQLDVDSRWAKIFSVGAKLAMSLIEIVSKKHAQVEVRWLSGNHDMNAAMCLTVALSLFYDNNQRVTVNDNPGIAYYRRFGNCLIGGNHGHTMRTAERMAMAMAVDCAADWGVTEHRHIFTGHLHHEAIKEAAGVRVETLGSPAARDAWNAASGYRSNRSLSAITFHNEYGEIGRHRVNISGPAAKAAA